MDGRAETDSAGPSHGAAKLSPGGAPDAAQAGDEERAPNGDKVDEPQSALLSQERLTAFSDGVFAVAITLLVFGIPQPHPKHGMLQHALLHLWPSYAAYAISFMTIGIIWVNHHGTFARVARVDRPLLFINLVFLMAVCFIPFPTSLLSQFVANGGDDAKVSAFVYAATMSGMSLSFGGMWAYATRRGMLHPEHSEQLSVVEAVVRFGGGGIVYGVCMGLAWLSPIADLVIFALLALYYVFDRQT